MHIVGLQESDHMAIKLIIEENTVYEIDEDCMDCQKRNGRRKSAAEEKGKSEDQRQTGLKSPKTKMP